MEIIRQKGLDLRKWWEQIENKEDIEQIVNNEEKLNNKGKRKYWWFSDNKREIITLNGKKISHYKLDEIEVLFDQSSEKVSKLKKGTESEISTDLFLSRENRVKDEDVAYKKAKLSKKKIFWFVSAWIDKAVIILDFSNWDEPKRTVYPLNKYNIRFTEPVNI